MRDVVDSGPAGRIDEFRRRTVLGTMHSLHALWILPACLVMAGVTYFLLLIASFYDEALGDAGALPHRAVVAAVALPAVVLLAATVGGCVVGRVVASALARSEALIRTPA